MDDLVYCPLYEKKIEVGDCFEISMVAEGMAPDRLLDRVVVKNENFVKICMTCENHKD